MSDMVRVKECNTAQFAETNCQVIDGVFYQIKQFCIKEFPHEPKYKDYEGFSQ